MSTETMMATTPVRSSTEPGVPLTLPKPGGSQDALPDLDALFFDERGAFLARAPIDGETVHASLENAAPRLLRAVVAPRGMQPEAAHADRSLPTVCGPLERSAPLCLPEGWWQALLGGRLEFFHGRAVRLLGDGEMPLASGSIEAFRVDPFAWIQGREDHEIARMRDRLSAWMPERRETPPTATGLEVERLVQLEGAPLRAFLLAHREALLPMIRQVLPEDWYVLTSLGRYAVDADGGFRGAAIFRREEEPLPHLAFRVFQHRQGRERALHHPPLCWGTWWHYSGQEIVLRLADAQALARELPPASSETPLAFAGVGIDRVAREGHGAGFLFDGPDAGCYRRRDGRLLAYSGELHLAMDADLGALARSGARFFRVLWSEADATEASPEWLPLTTPLSRRHRLVTEVDEVLEARYPVFSLAPAPGALPEALRFEEGVFALPDPSLDYVVADPAERAWGIWSARREGVATDAVLRFRVELFDADGQPLDREVSEMRVRFDPRGAEAWLDATPEGLRLRARHAGARLDGWCLVAETDPGVRLHRAGEQAIGFGEQPYLVPWEELPHEREGQLRVRLDVSACLRDGYRAVGAARAELCVRVREGKADSP